jgi:hypothetical protein
MRDTEKRTRARNTSGSSYLALTVLPVAAIVVSVSLLPAGCRAEDVTAGATSVAVDGVMVADDRQPIT